MCSIWLADQQERRGLQLKTASPLDLIIAYFQFQVHSVVCTTQNNIFDYSCILCHIISENVPYSCLMRENGTFSSIFVSSVTYTPCFGLLLCPCFWSPPSSFLWIKLFFLCWDRNNHYFGWRNKMIYIYIIFIFYFF